MAVSSRLKPLVSTVAIFFAPTRVCSTIGKPGISDGSLFDAFVAVRRGVRPRPSAYTCYRIRRVTKHGPSAERLMARPERATMSPLLADFNAGPADLAKVRGHSYSET
jgi:hypothetical protein